MSSRLVVATTCPTCSAPLDFSEGSNAVQCGYCSANLLVTGHKQVLSYFIAPKLELQRAVARVMIAHKEQGTPCRVIKPQLYFVPYYRFTGHDLRWIAGEDISQHWLPKLAVQEFADALRSVLPRPTFHDRYIETNFIACELPNTCAASLGVRAAVMRLELFQKDVLLSHGNIVAAVVPPKEALLRGMRAIGKQDLVYRQVLGLMLSMIYFPYWMVEVERQGKLMLSTVDAVAGNVIQLEAPVSMLDTLNRQPQRQPAVIGFRPLVCPNCGWDLPLRPHDVIFFCTTCDHAWEIYGQQLRQISYQFADLPQSDAQASVTHLPFWVMSRRRGEQDSERFFLPAFRYRRLKLLADLAHRITTKQPDYPILEGPKPEAYGCYYDHRDALKFAGFTHFGLQGWRMGRIKSSPTERLAFTNPTLTWIPFRRQGNYLVDPFTQFHLPEAALI